MNDIYSQGLQHSYDGPYVVIIKNGLPMSDDDVQEDLEEMQKKIKQLEADKERLDFLEKLPREYSGKIILRMSTTGRGFRLHESSQKGAVDTVREAIDNYKKSMN